MVRRSALRALVLLVVGLGVAAAPAGARSSSLAVTVTPTIYTCDTNGNWRVTMDITTANATGAPQRVASTTYTMIYRDRDAGQAHTSKATIYLYGPDPRPDGTWIPEGSTTYANVSTSGWYDYAVPARWPRCEDPVAMRFTVVTDTATGVGEGAITSDLLPEETPVPTGQAGVVGLSALAAVAFVLSQRRRRPSRGAAGRTVGIRP